MSETDTTSLLRRTLFADELLLAYAIVDGASVIDLLAQLERYTGDYCCLFAGKLSDELSQTAPYLIQLSADDAFADWLIEEGWGKHWSIFALLPATLGFRDVRKHFRSFLRVRSPEGNPLLFRYYDPRVFRVYLPSCNEKEKELIFGPVSTFIMEGDTGEIIQARHSVKTNALT